MYACVIYRDFIIYTNFPKMHCTELIHRQKCNNTKDWVSTSLLSNSSSRNMKYAACKTCI